MNVSLQHGHCTTCVWCTVCPWCVSEILHDGLDTSHGAAQPSHRTLPHSQVTQIMLLGTLHRQPCCPVTAFTCRISGALWPIFWLGLGILSCLLALWLGMACLRILAPSPGVLKTQMYQINAVQTPSVPSQKTNTTTYGPRTAWLLKKKPQKAKVPSSPPYREGNTGGHSEHFCGAGVERPTNAIDDFAAMHIPSCSAAIGEWPDIASVPTWGVP
mmetsp:Transcript_138837/g.241428  ORF Transcript_138837/g.241428 Transcript_138837/m.241428 type:complete len:215 (-) Transcript_138837:291-935(-)